MLRDILTNRWILGAIAFLVLLSVACVLWYQHDMAPYKQEAAEAAKIARQWDIEKAETDNTAETASPQAPADSTPLTVEKPVTEALVTKNTELTQTQMDAPASQAVETADVPVSPHGFGPYPEVPEDFPHQPFNWDFWGETPGDELMSRVQIKLWKQGIRSEGASFVNGKVYPTILGTVYVRWSADRSFIRGIQGHPDDDFDAIEAALEAGDPPPPGITVLDFSEGVDPYTFLELNK